MAKPLLLALEMFTSSSLWYSYSLEEFCSFFFDYFLYSESFLSSIKVCLNLLFTKGKNNIISPNLLSPKSNGEQKQYFIFKSLFSMIPCFMYVPSLFPSSQTLCVLSLSHSLLLHVCLIKSLSKLATLLTDFGKISPV